MIDHVDLSGMLSAPRDGHQRGTGECQCLLSWHDLADSD